MMKYLLYCPECGRRFSDTGFQFSCPNGCDSLVRTEYSRRASFNGMGIWRYIDYLPVNSGLDYHGYPAFFRSEEYSELYDSDVYFILNGYAPEFGVELRTCTFKELEAVVSLKYAEERGKSIALASVGNTATAFLELSRLVKNIHVSLFVPENVFDCMFEIERSENVNLILVKGGYGRAMELAAKFVEGKEDWVYEGGGKNVARRDGLATFSYAFYEKFGFIPDFYVQAVGSGTGAIAFYEGVWRLGFNQPSYVVAQNSPFTPIVDSWMEGKREIKIYDLEPLEVLYAKVLSNKKPLYSLRGGIYDILKETSGMAVAVSEKEARKAGKLFRKTYGFSLYPAAEVAMAVLDKIDFKGKSVLVNITGSGLDNLKKDFRPKRPDPDYIVESEDDLEMIR